MEGAISVKDLARYLNKKLKERKFLDALYLELSNVLSDPSIIPTLTADEICEYIIDHKLLDKLIKSDTVPGEDPFDLKKRNGDVIDDGDLDGDYDEESGIDEVWLKIFIQELVDLDPMMKDEDTQFTDVKICVSFNGERFVTQGYHIANNIRILQPIKFQLKKKSQKRFRSEDLLKLTSHLRITVYVEDTKTHIKTVKSVQDIEWRYVLNDRRIPFATDLASLDNSVFKLGQIKLEMVYGGRPKQPRSVSRNDLESRLRAEKEQITSKVVNFFEFAQDWWTEYKHLNPYFGTRSVKIYANDIFGKIRPTSHFVRRIRCRAISSPEEAARFVSLIPFQKKKLTRETVWVDIDTFLTEGRGSAVEHSILLCSLLLGFGYDAYVCIGKSSDGNHSWVFTRDEERVDKVIKKVWRIWESLTGKIFSIKDYAVKIYYSRISCAFNDKSFYGNVQDIEDVHLVSYDFENPKKWKSMIGLQDHLIPRSEFKLQMIGKKSEDVFEEEERLEEVLRGKIRTMRQSIGSTTEVKFDKDLGHILSMVLSKYELSRTMMIKMDGSAFMRRIRDHIDDSCTFKSFPIEFKHKDPAKMFAALQNNEVARSVIMSRGDQLRIGLRCKVVPYPEDVYAVWVVVAAYYIDFN